MDSWENAVRWYQESASSEEVRHNYMDLPQVSAARRFREGAEFRRTLQLLGRSPGSLVDLGAGWGFTSVSFAQCGWDVTAVEPDPSMLVGVGAAMELARQLSVPITVHCGNAEDIPVGDGTVDAVYGRQVLHHVADLDQTLREVARVLRPGGKAVFVREHVAETPAELLEFLTGHPLHARYGGENALPENAYLGAAHRAGLTLTRRIRPLESVINTYPLAAWQRLRSSLALILRSTPGRTLSMRQRALGEGGAGGRLYSFVWTKPTPAESA